jgi:hypothetical protein
MITFRTMLSVKAFVLLLLAAIKQIQTSDMHVYITAIQLAIGTNSMTTKPKIAIGRRSVGLTGSIESAFQQVTEGLGDICTDGVRYSVVFLIVVDEAPQRMLRCYLTSAD